VTNNFNVKNSLLLKYIQKDSEAAPLAVFRIIFGTMMFLGIIRFWAKGWIDTLYIQPKLFFSYYGFEWVKPLGNYTYALFFICTLSCVFIALGYKYRIAAITFFLSFTYIELMDKTTYLNHYYFVSLVGFLLILLPAGKYYSLDAMRNQNASYKVPQWTIDALKLMMAIVYFYAGLAKLNSDWLFMANPLKIWLAPKYDLPLIGPLLKLPLTAYLFSWFGALYDLAIPFLLLYRKTRVPAFIMVIIFHVLTWLLFPIGMFPFIMIGCALIFFSPAWHRNVLAKGAALIKVEMPAINHTTFRQARKLTITHFVVALFLIIQLTFPFRYLLYPGELFWTEEGYRFSWRVMLMEKAGYAQFTVKDSDTGHSFYVENDVFLTPFQEKQMAFQPDFILEYAHFLHDHYKKQGVADPIVTVESTVSLNGRPGATFIDPNVNLAKVEESFMPKQWINQFKDDIKGL
jgi:hypothetical protein